MILNRDYTVRLGTTASGIDSYIVKYRDFFTIVLSDSLSPQGRKEALEHELWHLEHDDFDREKDLELIEIRAHETPKQIRNNL